MTAVRPARTWTARTARKAGAVEPTSSPRTRPAVTIGAHLSGSLILYVVTLHIEISIARVLPVRKGLSSVATYEVRDAGAIPGYAVRTVARPGGGGTGGRAGGDLAAVPVPGPGSGGSGGGRRGRVWRSGCGRSGVRPDASRAP